MSTTLSYSARDVQTHMKNGHLLVYWEICIPILKSITETTYDASYRSEH